MILLPFRKQVRDSTFATLYGTIVAQARSPTFYGDYGVPDTVAGRLDMIVLHLVLFLGRLKHASPAGQALGQQVFDLFCRDIDDNFREMGMGDLSVPKQMRRVGETYYGRANAYEDALASGDNTTLVDALTRNIFGVPASGARRLAAYMHETMRELAAQDGFALGELRFPNPDSIAEVQSEGDKQP